MTALAQSIGWHAAMQPLALAIDDGAGGGLDWATLALALPAAVDRVRAVTGGRPVGVRVDHGAGACLLELALVEAGIVTVDLPGFFTAAQTDAALRAAGCGGTIRAASLVRAGASVELDLAFEGVDATPVALPDTTARISFTSGSTGDPKGICLSAAHLVSVGEAVAAFLGQRHAGRHLPLLPPGILLETVAGFYASILAGGCYVPLPQAQVGLANPFRPDFATVVRSIEALEITSLILVPEYLAGLVQAMETLGASLDRLTLVAVGGARVPPALLARATALGLPVRQGYGLTECGSVVTLEDGVAATGSVGRSIGANRVTLADDGEILIDGPLCLGTIGAPRAAGPLATGDLGRIDDQGRLWIEGRKSNLIVTSFGRNVSPEWVEGALLARPAIAQAMVRGDGEAMLEALIVPAAPDADIAAEVAAANAGLPVYARVARWRLVPPFTPMNGLLTGNGRLRRAAIDSRYPERPDVMHFFDRLVAETRDAQARFAATPQLVAGLTGQISRGDYIAYLTEAYHHVRHTVPLMQAARARLAHRPELVRALDDYIEEETGHEHWILDDIAAAGGDRAAAEASAPAPATAAMVDHAYHTIQTGNPAAFFGMVFVLEGTSVALASHGAAAVQARLGLPEGAFRYLTSHGALDQDHMKFFERLMNRIDDADDQAAIIAMARDMFGLFGGVFGAIELEAGRVAA